MAHDFPPPTTTHPIAFPDGTTHQGTVFLKAVIDHPNIEVGEYSYYSDTGPDPVEDHASHMAPYLYPGAPERLVIGKFCQIAHGACFVTSSANHFTGGLTTFPFPIFDPSQIGSYGADLAAQAADTVIGHDCWIGRGATILPGTRLGNGVIVGASAVVGGDIPDFSIVVGNPGRVLRRRHDPQVIDRLIALAWWDWPIERILDAVPLLIGGGGDHIDALEELARSW